MDAHWRTPGWPETTPSIYVESGNRDHVLLAVHDPDLAHLVDDVDITGAEIAVRGHDPGGFVRKLPIAGGAGALRFTRVTRSRAPVLRDNVTNAGLRQTVQARAKSFQMIFARRGSALKVGQGGQASHVTERCALESGGSQFAHLRIGAGTISVSV